ncbi:hypothetical protein [Konateibacter massiliensis]|uniref:hypothetical protein n=1 Tax=Konateibacter massiliensis TaxID=2002841 RepID=UPI000C162150|nr:hypothetical protein [Konateibacter massiliensis]
MKRDKIAVTLIISLGLINLVGCTKNNSLLDQFNSGQAIEIEVSGTTDEYTKKLHLTWQPLDKLQTYPDFRTAFDSALGIVAYGDDSKNGVCYIDEEGNQWGNNNLYNAFQNKQFITGYWENEEVQQAVQQAVSNVYTDVDADSTSSSMGVAKYAALNAYFNILQDGETGLYNADDTLSRAEVLSAVYRAEYPVTDGLTADEEFDTAVGTSEYNATAEPFVNYGYLGLADKSLNATTYNGTMTRAEAIYMLVQRYFADEYNSIDTSKASSYSDCKNGGDISKKAGFDKSDSKDYLTSYELVYSLQNVDKGAPEDLYKAMVVAKEIGLLGDNVTESNWDEAITKADLLEMVTNAYTAVAARDGYATDAALGANTGNASSTETGSETTDPATTIDREADASGFKGTVPFDRNNLAYYQNITEDTVDISAYSYMTTEAQVVAKTQADKKDLMDAYLSGYTQEELDAMTRFKNCENKAIGNMMSNQKLDADINSEDSMESKLAKTAKEAEENHVDLPGYHREVINGIEASVKDN